MFTAGLGREGVTKELMWKGGGHMEGMVSATPLSLAHSICTPGGLFCQLFASVGMKNTQEIKAGCEGTEQVKKGTSRAGKWVA